MPRLLRPLALIAVLVPIVLLGCDERSAEEKGRDYAREKVGFAQGAAEVLEKKGKGLGASLGKGVGDLVKGAGSAVKDVVHPPVKSNLAPEALDTGIKILHAHEGSDGIDARRIILSANFPLAFQGRMQLRGLGDGDREIARSQITTNIQQGAGSSSSFSFDFPKETRLSKIDHYVLYALEPKTLALSPDLKSRGLELSQLKERAQQVSVYVVFNKAYRGGLQMRASNARGDELGRSKASNKLHQDADSAGHFTFSFDSQTPLAEATHFVLHRVKGKASSN